MAPSDTWDELWCAPADQLSVHDQVGGARLPADVYASGLGSGGGPSPRQRTVNEVVIELREGPPIVLDADVLASHHAAVNNLVAAVAEWFLGQEDDPSWQGFLADLIMGLIPILGPGQDIIRYLVAKRSHTTVDHAFFGLACVGFCADIAIVFTAGTSALVSGATKAMRTILRMAVRSRKGSVFAEVLARSIMTAVQTTRDAEIFFTRIAPGVAKIVSNPTRLKQAVNTLGAIVGTEELFFLALNVFQQLSVEDAIAILQFVSQSRDEDLEPLGEIDEEEASWTS